MQGQALKDDDSPEFKEWLKRFHTKKTEAQADASCLTKVLPDMEFASGEEEVDTEVLSSQRVNEGSGSSREHGDMSLQSIEQILQTWKLPDFQVGPDTDIADIEFEEDEASSDGTLADEMEELRDRVDKKFVWKNKKLDSEQTELRAAAQVTLLLLDSSPDDSRSELVVRRSSRS